MLFQRFSSSDPEYWPDLHAVLQAGGAALLPDFPIEADHRSLKALAQALGEPLLEEHNTDGGMVCPVKVEPPGAETPYANTPLRFPCHTDCSDFARVPDVVIMLCERQAGSGGESLLASVDALAQRLEPADILALQRPDFLFRAAQYPILFVQEGSLCMRYNRTMIELFQQVYEWPENPAEQALFDRLDAAIASVSERFLLRAGDCIVLNNYRMLHGRESFAPDAQRLLQRVRLGLKASFY